MVQRTKRQNTERPIGPREDRGNRTNGTITSARGDRLSVAFQSALRQGRQFRALLRNTNPNVRAVVGRNSVNSVLDR